MLYADLGDAHLGDVGKAPPRAAVPQQAAQLVRVDVVLGGGDDSHVRPVEIRPRVVVGRVDVDVAVDFHNLR